MSSVLVLVLLLIAVPLQLFFSRHASTEDGKDAREEAVHSLSDVVTSSIAKLQSVGTYFSSWNRFRELFVVPSVKSRAHMSSSGHQSGGGVSVVRVSPKSAEEKKRLQKHSDPAATKPPKSADARQLKSEQQQEDDPLTTSPAKEVEQYLMDNVYFAQSKEPRDPRPAGVKFRVGQVVHHRQDQYVGVVIGWDAVGKTPEQWVRTYYSEDRKYLRDFPHYLILVDTHYDASDSPYRYIPQEDLKLLPEGTKVECLELSKYFEGYSDGRHLPKPWLQKRYPKD